MLKAPATFTVYFLQRCRSLLGMSQWHKMHPWLGERDVHWAVASSKISPRTPSPLLLLMPIVMVQSHQHLPCKQVWTTKLDTNRGSRTPVLGNREEGHACVLGITWLKSKKNMAPHRKPSIGTIERCRAISLLASPQCRIFHKSNLQRAKFSATGTPGLVYRPEFLRVAETILDGVFCEAAKDDITSWISG